MAEGLALGVHDHGVVFRLNLPDQAPQHVDHAEHGMCRLAVPGGEPALAADGMVRPEQEG